MLAKIILYLITDSINKLLPFLSVFLFAKYTTAELTGYYSLYVILYSFFFSLLMMGIQAKVIKIVISNNALESKILTVAYIFCFFNYVIVNMLVFFVSIFIDINVIHYVLLACSFLFSIGQIKAATYRAKEKVYKFASVNIYFSLVLFFMVMLKINLDFDVFYIWIYTLPFYFAYCFFRVYYDWDFNLPYVKSELVKCYFFGLGQLGHILSMWGRFAIDRVYIYVVLSVTIMGYYSMIMNIGLVVSMFSQSLNNYFSVYLFKCLSRKQYSKAISASFIFSIAIVCFSLFFIGVAYIIVNDFLPADYSEYFYLLPVIVIAFCLQGFYLSIVNYIFYIEKTYLLNIPSLISTVSMLVMSYFFIDFFGVLGAAISLLISWFVQFVLSLIIVVRFKNEIFC